MDVQTMLQHGARLDEIDQRFIDHERDLDGQRAQLERAHNTFVARDEELVKKIGQMDEGLRNLGERVADLEEKAVPVCICPTEEAKGEIIRALDSAPTITDLTRAGVVQ